MFKKSSEDYWIPLADLMTGMMLIFLLISVVLVIQMKYKEAEKQTLKEELAKELATTFKNDLNKWHATFKKDDLSIQFMEPDILFETGKTELRPAFKNILDDFFPRYIAPVHQKKYLSQLREIRI